MNAIFETGGKQYRVAIGDTIYVEKLPQEPEQEVVFDKVLLVGSKVGSPYVKDAKVTGVVEKHGRGKKVIIFKMKPKKNYHKKQGHRQPYTKVSITNIEG